MTNYGQLNESNLSFILKINLLDTTVYNAFTLFTFQSSLVQIPTASADRLTYLIKYIISPSTFIPLTKRDTSSYQLIYLNRVT